MAIDDVYSENNSLNNSSATVLLMAMSVLVMTCGCFAFSLSNNSSANIIGELKSWVVNNVFIVGNDGCMSVTVDVRNGPMYMTNAMITVPINNNQSGLCPMTTAAKDSMKQQTNLAHGQEIKRKKVRFWSESLVQNLSNCERNIFGDL